MPVQAPKMRGLANIALQRTLENVAKIGTPFMLVSRGSAWCWPRGVPLSLSVRPLRGPTKRPGYLRLGMLRPAMIRSDLAYCAVGLAGGLPARADRRLTSHSCTRGLVP